MDLSKTTTLLNSVLIVLCIPVSCSLVDSKSDRYAHDYFPLYMGYTATYIEQTIKSITKTDANGNSYLYDSAECDTYTIVLKEILRFSDSTTWYLMKAPRVYIVNHSGAPPETLHVERTQYISSEGNDVYRKTRTGRYRVKIAQHTFEGNEQWKTDTPDEIKQMEVFYAGAVTVPAGTFNSCYSTVSIDTSSDIRDTVTYAPGVGEIRRHYDYGPSVGERYVIELLWKKEM